MITNPNSATQRIKNHLSYKLGQELIKYNTGGGGNPLSLIFHLLKITKITKSTKNLQQSFPSLTTHHLINAVIINKA
ncbi:hypothetical protein NYG95_06845 [Campylobacter felis]|uniref:Sugar transferase n=1 Tax=Campylobacter felis TaxID=2974565 RepID=A0ABT7I525_9BACT|nr:hypothetical protein [Campylobacter felis]